MPGFNGIGWFEIGTGDPAAAERFYGEVFGWTVEHDDGPGADQDYRLITTGDPEGLHGGLRATKGETPGYALFSLLVEDVEDACRRAEAAGGKVQRTPQVNAAGVAFLPGGAVAGPGQTRAGGGGGQDDRPPPVLGR